MPLREECFDFGLATVLHYLSDVPGSFLTCSCVFLMQICVHNCLSELEAADFGDMVQYLFSYATT